jgi:hypothetical protein
LDKEMSAMAVPTENSIRQYIQANLSAIPSIDC